jgi:RNA polymerase sigma-70 factor, ECF subfamily
MSTSQSSDEELVVAIREKDRELYSVIIHRYKTKLSHYLRKFIRDADELEDVLQDVFIKAYHNLYGFNVNKKFSPWIYRIAHNEALNHIKKNSRFSFSLDETEYEVVDEKMHLDSKIDNKLLKNKIEEELSKMKDKYREPIIFYFFEQKTYEEISDILHIPTSTVGTLISRGKKILRESLQKIYASRS